MEESKEEIWDRKVDYHLKMSSGSGAPESLGLLSPL